MAYKVFSNGSVLNASDLNDYLMNQSVMVFSSSTARASAITSPVEGMMTYLDDTNVYQYWNGSAWTNLIPTTSTGKVAQVLSTTKTDTFSASLGAGSGGGVTGLSQTITPSSASSKVLVMLSINGNNANYGGFAAYLKRGGTDIAIGDAAGNRSRVGATNDLSSAAKLANVTITFLDSPATTSPVTYEGWVRNVQSTTRTVYVNRTETDSDSVDFVRTASTITVMEILA